MHCMEKKYAQKILFVDLVTSRYNPFVNKDYYLDIVTNFYYFKSRYKERY